MNYYFNFFYRTIAKTRAKVKSMDAIPQIIKLLSFEDAQILVNACECISNLAEDSKL